MIQIGTKIGNKVITGIKLIKHGKYYPNKNIKAEVLLEGKRNAEYKGYIYQDNSIRQIIRAEFHSIKKGLTRYDGVNRKTEKIITIV